MTQYHSIIRLFEHCGIDCNALDVAKARRILAAEFSIARNGIISIAGFDYTKNDVFNELERHDFAQRLTVHVLIWRMPVLLNCLEKNEIDIGQIDKLGSWYSHYWRQRHVVDFISPYFAVSFDKIMGRLLNSARFADANTWMKTLYFAENAEDNRAALSSTRIYFADFIKLLRNMNDVTYKDHLPQVEKFFSQPWCRFVNNFPDSLYGIRNDLLRTMYNFAIIIRHTDTNLYQTITRQMIEVRNIDTDLRDLIAGTVQV